MVHKDIFAEGQPEVSKCEDMALAKAGFFVFAGTF